MGFQAGKVLRVSRNLHCSSRSTKYCATKSIALFSGQRALAHNKADNSSNQNCVGVGAKAEVSIGGYHSAHQQEGKR